MKYRPITCEWYSWLKSGSWAVLSTGEHVHSSHVHIHVHVHDHVAVAPGESTHLVRLARHDRSTLIWFCRPNSTVSPSLEMIRGISITRSERENEHLGWYMLVCGGAVVSKFQVLIAPFRICFLSPIVLALCSDKIKHKLIWWHYDIYFSKSDIEHCIPKYM